MIESYGRPKLEIPVWAGVVLIAATTVAAYWPALHGEFIWDDRGLITNSPLIQDPSGLRRIWFSTEPTDYWPVTYTAFWLEWRAFGDRPLGYHLVNLLVHLATCLLLWRVLRQLSIPGAFLAALIFAVHPVNVGAVAWISQLKALLAGWFFVLSIACYFHGSRWAYWASFIAFALGVLSKGTVVILPLVLLLLIWWSKIRDPEPVEGNRSPERITRADVLKLVPFFALAFATVPLNLWFRTHGHTVEMRDVGFVERLLGAVTAIWFYLGKALVPVNLSFVYPLWNVDPGELRWWLPLAAAIGVTLALWFARGNPVGRSLLVAWLYFCIALLPVLGFAQVGYMVFSPVADYYAHLALMGVVALVGAGWYLAYQRAALPACAVAVLIVGALLLLARQQAALYQSAESIWQDTARNNPTGWVAHDNLGFLLFNAGRTDEALEHFREALSLRPDRWESWFNVGNVLHRSGRWDQSIEYLEHAVQLNAELAEAHAFLALAYAKQGRRADAIAAAENAIRAAQATGQSTLEQGVSEWLAKYRTQP